MAQQQTPSWADLTHRVFVFMFDSQDREQENCFHWDQPQLFLQKQLVERLCCFWSRYAMNVRFLHLILHHNYVGLT
ncbi:unnamed protein product, partial [Rangifer tarandus platyrhynchus]